MAMRAGGRRPIRITQKTLDHIVRDLQKLLAYHASLPEPIRRSAYFRKERRVAKAMLAVRKE